MKWSKLERAVGMLQVEANPGRLMRLLVIAVLAVCCATDVMAVTCADVQASINALPSRGGEVVLKAKTYKCSSPIVIDRDNVVLRGSGPGTVLSLSNQANAPVIVIGQTAAVPTMTRRKIQVSDLEIDGNRANQQFECWRGPCGLGSIRNNGITIRRGEDVRVERVTVRSARSAGLVTEFGCRRITVRDFTATDSEFDGLAGYQTEDSVFTGLNLYANVFAGLSFDIAFNRNLITASVLADNGDVGIFMRDSRDNVFSGLQVLRSGNHGVFLAQVEADATKPAAGNTFSDIVVANSDGVGIFVADPSCVDNALVATQLVGNTSGCTVENAPLSKAAVICR